MSSRVILLLLLFFVSLTYPPFFPISRAETYEPIAYGSVRSDRVNLRAGPDERYEVLTQFSRGSGVHILTKQESWYAVLLPPEVKVYVFRQYLLRTGEWATVQGKRVSARAGAGFAFSRLGWLNAPEKVRVRRTIGEWIEIDPPTSARGWIHEQWVTVLEPFRKGQEE